MTELLISSAPRITSMDTSTVMPLAEVPVCESSRLQEARPYPYSPLSVLYNPDPPVERVKSRVRLPVGYGLDSYLGVYRLGKPNRIIEYIHGVE